MRITFCARETSPFSSGFMAAGGREPACYTSASCRGSIYFQGECAAECSSVCSPCTKMGAIQAFSIRVSYHAGAHGLSIQAFGLLNQLYASTWSIGYWRHLDRIVSCREGWKHQLLTDHAPV